MTREAGPALGRSGEGPCRIAPEPVSTLTAERRATLLQAGVRAAPSDVRLRAALVDLLYKLSRFQEVEDLIAFWPDGERSHHAQLVLASCLLVPHDVAGNTGALAAAARAVDLAASAQERADALALRAKAERRLGDEAAAKTTLRASLVADPNNSDACKRLAALLIGSGAVEDVIALTDDLLGRGIAHPQVLNSRAVAQARLGLLDAARETIGYDRFAHRALLDPPPGYRSIPEFNAAVAAELLAHPARRIDPHGSASRETIRVDAPTSGRAPLAVLLMEHITRAVETYVSSLPADPHPWRCARPAKGIVHGTCAITAAEGYETWHIHQRGWLSGVYYVDVPDEVIRGTDRRGCIAFGLDSGFAGAEAAEAFGETVVRPTPGMLMLFPSHAYHRTYPHGEDGRRICMAFDMWPR